MGEKHLYEHPFIAVLEKRFEGLFLVEVTYVCSSFKHLLDLLVYQRLSSPFQFKLLFVFFSCLFSQLYITQLLLQIYCFLFPAPSFLSVCFRNCKYNKG